jgi:tetratricopeptide (TPR) repeat protein
VKLDLGVAAGLDAELVNPSRATIDAELARAEVHGAPEPRLTELEQSARSGAAMDRLVELAVALHRAAGAPRLRYDEGYQERLRELEAAVRARPGRPDRLLDLARYLTDEADGRGEAVEPWHARGAELARAEGAVDEALRLERDHVGALMQKATIRSMRGQDTDADSLATRALALAPNNPDALRMYARYRARQASALSARAAGMRQPECTSSSSTETRSDGIYRVTRTTCVPPSHADMQQSSQLDAQAAELRRRAMSAMEAAARVSSGTMQGLLIQADLELWRNQPAAAIGAVQEAVRLDPRSIEAHERLADLYRRAGQRDRAAEQAAAAINLVHTTAAPLLRLVWEQGAAKAWSSARATLAAASRLDPVDASTLLVESHTGAGRILKAMGRTDDALREFAAAAAYQLPAGIPRVGTAVGDTNFKADAPAGEAALELARAAYEAGQYERAFQIIQGATGSFPPERRREVNELMMRIARELNARRGR